jgi:hypothetical protein
MAVTITQAADIPKAGPSNDINVTYNGVSFRRACSILLELKGFGRTLIDTGQAFDAIFRPRGDRFVPVQCKNFAGTDLNTVSAAVTLSWIDGRVHFKLQMSNSK